MKPSNYWDRRNDIDLIWGSCKYGLGSYPLMKEDPKSSFYFMNKESTNGFPLAELVTRRLKKLA